MPVNARPWNRSPHYIAATQRVLRAGSMDSYGNVFTLTFQGKC